MSESEKKSVIKTLVPVNSSSKYTSNITSNHFMFNEMRVTASLMVNYSNEADIINMIVKDNLYQLPSEKKLRSRAIVCLKRLKLLNSSELIEAIANKSISIAKQICLYAMMRSDRIVWEFMVLTIGSKVKIRDYSFSKSCINAFLFNLQSQNEVVAKWSPKTIHRIGEVLGRILIENGYIENSMSDKLTPPIVDPLLAKVIKLNGDNLALSIFENLG